MKTKFSVLEKKSTKHSNLVIGDHETSSRENTWAYISTKTEFRDTYRKNCLKASATLRHTVQTEGNIKQRPISTVYSILGVTNCLLWRSIVWIWSENKATINPDN